MKRDMSVTVTRDSRVTSQVPRHCDVTALSRVSHATTTTPHHTMSVSRGCLSRGQDRIRSNGYLPSAPRFGFGDEIR